MNEAYAGGDLSLRRDLTSLVVVVRERARRPAASDHLVVRSIETWDPKASPTKEVDFDEVRADLEQLPRRFPGLKQILVDAGAESSSILPWARQHPRLSLLVQPFTATADSNMQIWSALVARLNARTIAFPRHERLLAELRGLRAESFAFGSKWRVVDASRRFHRDVSFALALAVFAAGAARTCTSPLCTIEGCDGLPPLSLLFSAESRAWDAMHPSPEALAEREKAEAAIDAEAAAASEAESEDDGPSLSARVRELVAQGVSRLSEWRDARHQRTHQARIEREQRIARWLQQQRNNAEAAEQRAAVARAAQDLADRVHQGGGAWFPWD